MPQHIISRSVKINGLETRRDVTVTSGVEINLDETYDASTTNRLTAFALDVSQCKSLFITASATVTIKTNSSGSPANTITLAADRPFSWVTGDPTLRDTAGVDLVDITSIYITCTPECRLQIFALSDPTV